MNRKPTAQKLSIDQIEKLINADHEFTIEPDGSVRDLTQAEIAECEAVEQRAKEKVAMQKSKPILCLDFDGVIHSYASGWKGADVIPDPPVDGAMKFIWDATEHFRVAIFSSRSNQRGGMSAMKSWLTQNFRDYWGPHRTEADDKLAELEWPNEKPAAMITLDDRALTFEGTWPEIEALKEFQPWNKRPLGATGTFPMGKVSADDEGALKIAIGRDELNGIVRVDFGKPTAWIGMPPPNAIEFAKTILKHAGAKKIEITL